MYLNIPSPLQEIKSPLFERHEIQFWLKRDDLIHPEISGNKWRKLELNVIEAKNKKQTLLTFGGAYSNHIAATASICHHANVQCVGLIRGEEHKDMNPTLKRATQLGMKLHFISRSEYQKKNESHYINSLMDKFGAFHLVPEGGANTLGVIGSAKIVSEIERDFDVICGAIGTGTTVAGMLFQLRDHQTLEAYSSLKGGDFLKNDIQKLFLKSFESEKSNEGKLLQMKIILDYHFGGFAKLTPQHELINFVNDFYKSFEVPLDLIYNGKMMYGIFDRIRRGFYKKGTKIVVVHCGGLQGNIGMKERYGLELGY